MARPRLSRSPRRTGRERAFTGGESLVMTATAPITSYCVTALMFMGNFDRCVSARRRKARPPGRASRPPRSSVRLADRRDADRGERAPFGRNGQSALLHEPADQRGSLWMRRGGLDADAHEAVGVIDRLPREARERVHGVAAADVVQRQV